MKAAEYVWLLEQIADYDDARLCGDEDRQRDVLLQVVNRCAQLAGHGEVDLRSPDQVCDTKSPT